MRPDWMHADGGEALVEAMDDVQDDRVISDDPSYPEHQPWT